MLGISVVVENLPGARRPETVAVALLAVVVRSLRLNGGKVVDIPISSVVLCIGCNIVDNLGANVWNAGPD